MADPQSGDPGQELSVPAPDPFAAELRSMGAISEIVGERAQLAACNFPLDPIERYSLMALATDSGVASIADLIGEEFSLRYWFVHNVTLQEGSGGEIIDAPRVVLIDDDGLAVAAVSSGIYKALQLLVRAYGPGPLVDPVRIKFTQSKTRQGWRLLSFVPVRQKT